MEIGFKQEIENGPAQILATIDDQPELFDIEIMDVDLNPRESNKGIRFQVTDANLIRKNRWDYPGAERSSDSAKWKSHWSGNPCFGK